MRHQKKRHKLGRTASHRKATLAALGTALIRHKRITTTVTKAKALRVYIEPLITRSKEDTSHNRRQVFRRLQDNATVSELFTDVSAQVGDRPGGYTRVVKLGRRAGDGAPMAIIELVDYNDVRPEDTGGSSKRTRRGGGSGRRRSGPKGAETKPAAATASTTETTAQVDTAEKGVESETVEKPAAEEQAQPVVERTEAGDVPDGQIEAAKKGIDEQEPEADESDQSADSGESVDGDDDEVDAKA
jgi:large subunit ribosomal protein L17